MYKKIILVSFLICFSSSMKSQNTIDKENVFVHFNTSNYLVGETIYFKIYNLKAGTNEFSELSKIAYLEIVDENKKSIIKQKVLLQKGVAYGDIFLPADSKTGVYKIVAYSSFMQNQPISTYFIEDIIIVNPYQSILSENTVSNFQLKEENIQKVTNDYIDISLDKKTFSKREKINLNFKEKKEATNPNLSISIKKIDQLNQKNLLLPIKEISQKNNSSSTFDFNLPEIRGEVVKGKIISKNNTSVDNKNVSLSISGINFDFKVVKTNSKGEFYFMLDNLPNKNDIIIQVFEENRRNYSVEIIQNIKDFSSLVFDQKLAITPDIKKIIEKRSISNQIENAYFTIKKDTIKEEKIKKPFYFPLAKTISLDDYTRFPKLNETIIEILPQVSFKEKSGNYSINLTNNKFNDGENGTALVLIDGLLIQNVKELFEYDTRYIDRIDLITDKYIYGSKIYNGIINFITKEFNYELQEKGDYILKTEIQRPLNKKYYYNQNYSDISKYERIPDYRYQLLWMPEVDLNKTISFYTSDITGQFEINIEGFTSDGKPISSKEYFEVK